MYQLETIGIERINVNLSAKSYLNELVSKKVKEIMQKYQVQIYQIWFELTETAQVEDHFLMYETSTWGITARFP